MERQRLGTPEQFMKGLAEALGLDGETVGEGLVAIVLIKFSARPYGPRKVVVDHQVETVGTHLDETG